MYSFLEQPANSCGVVGFPGCIQGVAGRISAVLYLSLLSLESIFFSRVHLVTFGSAPARCSSSMWASHAAVLIFFTFFFVGGVFLCLDVVVVAGCSDSCVGVV